MMLELLALSQSFSELRALQHKAGWLLNENLTNYRLLHHELTWVEDGTGTALDGPGLWVKVDASSRDLHQRVLVQDLFDLDFHLGVGAFIMS